MTSDDPGLGQLILKLKAEDRVKINASITGKDTNPTHRPKVTREPVAWIKDTPIPQYILHSHPS